MLKKLVLAAVVAAGAFTAASAQDVPKDTDACFNMSGALLESASDVAEVSQAKVEQLVKELESACDAGKFADAAAKAKEVKALIGAK